jgi:hypothetical protein
MYLLFHGERTVAALQKVFQARCTIVQRALQLWKQRDTQLATRAKLEIKQLYICHNPGRETIAL